MFNLLICLTNCYFTPCRIHNIFILFYTREDGDLRPNTIGCAITFKNWLQGQMDTIASAVNVLSLVPLLGAIYSFCMIFKRKAEDVLPERYVKSALESEGEQGKMPA